MKNIVETGRVGNMEDISKWIETLKVCRINKIKIKKQNWLW
jgi:hypothetical protein